MANQSGVQSGFQSVWNLGANAIAERRARKQALSDAEFQGHANRLAQQLADDRAKLGTIDPQRNPTEFADVQAGMAQTLGDIRTLYHPDHRPDAVARFGHILTDKLGLTNPQERIQKEAARRAGLVAGEQQEAAQMAAAAPSAPSQQYLEQQARQAAQAETSGEEERRNWQLDWAKRHGIPEPAMQELSSHLAGVPVAKPETEGQRTRNDYADYQKSHPEYQGTYEQWKPWQAAQGRAEVPKRQSNDDRFLAVQQKRAAGQPLSADDQAFEQGYKALIKAKVVDPKVAGYAALGASHVGQYVDPDNPTETVVTTAGDAMRRGLRGTSSIDFRIQMPTAQERGRADLAVSARDQLNTMSDILSRRSDLFGPVSGRQTNFSEWIGSQDPDAQRFAAAARIAADHLAGVFGGRSEAALTQIYDIVGRNATNPAAALAGIEQMNVAAATIQGRGSVGGAGGPAPGGKQTPGAMKKQAQKNLGNADPLGVL